MSLSVILINVTLITDILFSHYVDCHIADYDNANCCWNERHSAKCLGTCFIPLHFATASKLFHQKENEKFIFFFKEKWNFKEKVTFLVSSHNQSIAVLHFSIKTLYFTKSSRILSLSEAASRSVGNALAYFSSTV